VNAHIEDAMRRGELQPEPRICDRQILDAIQLHVHDSSLLDEIKRAVTLVNFYEPRKFRPDLAVGWAIGRRALFPSSPFTKAHVDIARQAAAASQTVASQNEPERLRRRAKWLRQEMQVRQMSIGQLKAAKGPDPKTTQKVLDAVAVSDRVLGRLAEALNIPRTDIP
jgi:hypothetical protein